MLKTGRRHLLLEKLHGTPCFISIMPVLCVHLVTDHTDKKENQIFLIYQEIQSGAVAKS
jgi:hypothetical protein